MAIVPRNWKITMLLADGAQSINGKLFILGGGWDSVAPVPIMMSLAILVSVPWDEANRKHRLKLRLRTADGAPFTVPGPTGSQPLEITTEFETGRPAGVHQGSSLSVPLAINIGPLQFSVGAYEWVCSINDIERDDWKLPFYCRQLQQGLQVGFPPPSA